MLRLFEKLFYVAIHSRVRLVSVGIVPTAAGQPHPILPHPNCGTDVKIGPLARHTDKEIDCIVGRLLVVLVSCRVLGV
jgi:hypothetical protein